jgi:general secretion pathway protein A
VGTGKTTLLYSILSRRNSDLTAAYVSYSAQSFEDLLAGALRDLGVATTATGKRTLLENLNDYLRRQADERRNTALIIDEAQNLSVETFEELRLLSNFESYTRKLLQIVLVGQPELAERLRQPALRQLRERVSVRAYVNPLSREEMAGYIAHRLKVAGGDAEQIFSPRALSLIIRRTKGIPRRANILCHNALLFAYGRHLAQVTMKEAREAIAEMDERRPGRFPRAALRRLRWNRKGWRWAAALGGAFAIGTTASLFMSSSELEMRSSMAASTAQVEPDPPRDLAIAGATGPAAVVRSAEPAAPVVAVVPAASAEETSVPPPADPEPIEDEETSVASDDRGPSVAAEEETRSVVVPTGGALWTILRQAYGDEFSTTDRAALFAQVRRLNPHVKNVNVIMAGDRLRLPMPARARP